MLETLPPDVARLLYPERNVDPLTVTLVYPELEGLPSSEAAGLEAAATSHSVVDSPAPGQSAAHETTFTLQQVEEFHRLYDLVENAVGADNVKVLLNGRTVPLVRELWLPLIWTLRR